MRNRLHCEVSFASGAGSDAYKLYGWHGEEAKHTWSRGLESALEVPAFGHGAGLAIEIACGSHHVPGKLEQSVLLRLNGRPVGRPTPITNGTYAWVAEPPPRDENRSLFV